MSPWLYVIVYSAASLLWLFYFSAGNKIPASRYLQIFVLGILAAPLAGLVSGILGNLYIAPSHKKPDFAWDSFFLYFFIVGPVEELLKFLALFLGTIRISGRLNIHQSMTLAIAAALGFAFLENILYLFRFGAELTWPRLLLANLGHAGYSLFWGYAFGAVFFERAPARLLVSGLIVSALLHGAYDYFLGFSLAGLMASLFLSVAVIAAMFWLLKSEKKQKRP